MTIECIDLTVSVNGRVLIGDLNLQLSPGAFVCMLGPNGVGKTLTLHTLAGLREISAGSVRLNGNALGDMDRTSIARHLGLLMQSQDDVFPTTVLETALMGRHPWLDFWSWETQQDTEIAQQALAAMDLSALSQRMAATLSGGERRRLALATLLVQDPKVLLLDEPMNHLDPLHKLQVLTAFSALATRGKIVIASLHDPVLASKYFDSALLMHGDGRWEFGTTAEMLTAAKLESLYGTPFQQYRHDGQSVLLPVPPRQQA
jgi:iron complex transport system ATP-binding protein